jgi:glycine cleavage system pyridoxal-binding protein P
MNTATAKTYRDDFRQFWLEGDVLQSAPSAAAVPDEAFDDACTIGEAVSFVQRLGCAGRSQHIIKDNYHATALAVLRMAVEQYGEDFPELLRGTRSNRSDSDHKILFGTTDRAVAEQYGIVRAYRNVRGLRTSSLVLSVVTDDYGQQDEEIIFFP